MRGSEAGFVPPGSVSSTTAAAQIGFTKVELRGDNLTLHFPSADTKEFYEGTDGTTPRFQLIMNRVGELNHYRASLKQEGKRLKLVARLDQVKEPQRRIAQVGDLLRTLSYTHPVSSANI